MTVFSRPDGDRVVVSVCGELDLGADQRLRQILRPAPSGPDDGVQLDLDGVEFCDCSALRLLLNLKEQALPESVPVAAPAEAVAPHGATARRATTPADDPSAELRRELEQLRRAMQSRGTIDLARGILMAAFAVSADDAWKVLVATSQHTNIKLRSLAEQVVESAAGTPLPEGVRERLCVAVAKASAGSSRRGENGSARTTAPAEGR
ncbi:ANTAR domain-containing protein [Streptomyces sp. NPDC006632]|uniref:ANTAR domain-containing protein n=1 Tax=unclassified Streptomyces TaxID=2593676 RepID=UPI002E215E12